MFKIDNKGSCDITNLQCSLCCGGGVSGSGIYNGTGFFGPGFPNTGTLVPDTMTINNAISLLRQPNTYYPTHLGLGLGGMSGPHESAIVIGDHVDNPLPNNGTGTISIGRFTGQVDQELYSIAIGDEAGQFDQLGFNVAIGPSAGNSSQGIGGGYIEGGSVALGVESAVISQGGVSVAIGAVAGSIIQGQASVAIGFQSGFESQGNAAVSVGYATGKNFQGYGSVAIGSQAGTAEQGENSVAIGILAGTTGQGTSAIAIGDSAGSSFQRNNSIAIGMESGKTNQNEYAISIGTLAGFSNQGINSISIGYNSGSFSQNTNAISIGILAGNTSQGTGAISIGNSAGEVEQGSNSISIGNYAGTNYQDSNSIVINATGNVLGSTGVSTCVIAPIRNSMGSNSTHMFYDTVTGELTWGSEAPSSMRFKKDIVNMSDNYSDAVFKLRPVEFKYKSNDKIGIGFIAEEVYDVLPEIVIKNVLTNEIESVDYQYLVGPLVKIIQQQQQDINMLKEKLGL